MSNLYRTKLTFFGMDGLFRRALHKYYSGKFGFGKPDSKEKLEYQYKNGEWDFLESLDELANYMVVAGYVKHYSGQMEHEPRILDLGCGSGRIAELLLTNTSCSYVGIDISAEAVNRANARRIEGAEFYVSQFEEEITGGEFDIIISTGAIHYARDAVGLLKEKSNLLSNDGKIVISLWRHENHAAIWRRLENHFSVLDSTVVQNKMGVVWDIKVLS